MISKSNNNSYYDGTSAFSQRFFQETLAPKCRWVNKNADPDIYKYSSYSIFDSSSDFSLPDNSMGNNVIIFGVYMSSSVHINNKEKIS